MSEPQRPNEGPMLPVAGLVLSVVGLCLPPVMLVAFGIGLYSFLRSKRDAAWAGRKQLAQLTMAVSGAGFLIFIGLALPNFKRLQLRVRQTECREVLTRLGEAERRYYAKNSRYTTSLAELDPLASRGRQLVRLSAEGPLWTEGPLKDEYVGSGFDTVLAPLAPTAQVDAALPKLVLNDVGVRGTCPACTVTLLCAAELDGDATPDVWTWSTIERLGNEGAKIPGGLAWNEVDDVNQ